MWFRLAMQALIALMISIVLYGGLLPHMVSSSDTLMVLLGIFLAFAWILLLINFFAKRVRKALKCVKF